MYNAIKITIEGEGGSGKTTAAKAIIAGLNDAGFNVYWRPPGECFSAAGAAHVAHNHDAYVDEVITGPISLVGDEA